MVKLLKALEPCHCRAFQWPPWPLLQLWTYQPPSSQTLLPPWKTLIKKARSFPSTVQWHHWLRSTAPHLHYTLLAKCWFLFLCCVVVCQNLIWDPIESCYPRLHKLLPHLSLCLSNRQGHSPLSPPLCLWYLQSYKLTRPDRSASSN